MKLKLITFLLLSFVGFSQTKSILDSVKINKKTKLIGMYAQYDKSKTYQYLNFFIDDKNIIESLKSKLTHGKIVENRIEQNDFRIIVLNGNEEVENWMLSPMNSNILMNGVYYDFNPDVVKDLAKKYPFEYTFYEKNFSNKKEYEEYKTKMSSDKNFLFAYEPFFEYEGTFEIKFPKNSEFESPQMIDDYLRPEINKIVKEENQFNISYILDERNLKNRDEYIITIECNKEVFEKLKLKKLKKINWKNNQPSGMFFMKQ
jgi:hypothetical protein